MDRTIVVPTDVIRSAFDAVPCIRCVEGRVGDSVGLACFTDAPAYRTEVRRGTGIGRAIVEFRSGRVTIDFLPQARNKGGPENRKERQHRHQRHRSILLISAVAPREQPHEEEPNAWTDTNRIVHEHPEEADLLTSVQPPEVDPLVCVHIQLGVLFREQLDYVAVVSLCLCSCAGTLLVYKGSMSVVLDMFLNKTTHCSVGGSDAVRNPHDVS
jgi:hypothetical protein